MIIYLDADDTIMPTYLPTSITEETKEAIKLARNKGYKVRLATGRTYASARHIQKEIGTCDYLILFNGALITDGKGNIVYQNALDKEKLEQIIKISRDTNTNLTLYKDLDVYADKTSARIERYIDHNNENLIIDNLDNIDSSVKAMFMGDNEDLRKIKPIVDKIKGIRSIFSKPHYLEIVNESVSKGSAIEYLTKKENKSLDNVIAFGDQWNDYEMLKMVGMPFLMGNANKELKEIFDKKIHIDSVHNNGVAKKILEIVND